MKRRTALLGLGSLAIGSGALIGSGAFTTVEAQRTVSVETTGDADALLTLTDATNGNYVAVNDGVIEIDVGDASAGVNQRARTVLDELINIENNGSQNVTSISFEILGDNGENELLTPIPEDGYGDGGVEFPEPDDSVLAPDDEDPVTLGLEIELRAAHLTEPETITAYNDGNIDQTNFAPTILITADTA